MVVRPWYEPDYVDALPYTVDGEERWAVPDDITLIIPHRPPHSNRIALYVGDFYRFKKGDGGLYEFIGFYKSFDIVPNIRSCYVVNNALFINNGPPILPDQPEIKRRNRKDTSRLLNTTITKYDDDLMIIAKKILEGTTLKEFKEMYPNDSEMNNIRRIIEYDPTDNKAQNKGSLSWQRLKSLLDRAGYDYDLMVTHKRTKALLNFNETNRMSFNEKGHTLLEDLRAKNKASSVPVTAEREEFIDLE